MKRFIAPILFCFLLYNPLSAFQTLYAEQYYRLYHQHFYYYPEDSAENIYYLGMALRSDFANPLNALARIEDEKQWEKYRYLFYMHVNLLIVDSYLKMGSKYDKQEAYFYNYPWKYANLESLDAAESYYELALEFWRKAREWSLKASDNKFAWMYLEDIQFWEDENYRIQEGDLDYEAVISRELSRLQRVREKFQTMDKSTY
jgi:hypothetical protein